MGNLWADAYRTLREDNNAKREPDMSRLPTIIRATQASARALGQLQRWTFVMNDLARQGLRYTPKYQQASLNACRAQRRYANAQKELDRNPL